MAIWETNVELGIGSARVSIDLCLSGDKQLERLWRKPLENREKTVKKSRKNREKPFKNHLGKPSEVTIKGL